MDNINIAIVKKNDFIITDEDTKKLTLNEIKQKIIDSVEENVIIQSIPSSDLMKTIIGTLKMDNNVVAETHTCHENSDNIFQLCHLPTHKKEDINGLSSYLTIDSYAITGDTILLNSKINDNKTCSIETLCFDDVVNIIYNNIVHTGLKVSVDGVIEEYIYFNNPLYLEKNLDNYGFIEFSIFNFFLVALIEKYPTIDKRNKSMTCLVGNKIINGDVVLVLKLKESIYGNLNKNTFKKLLLLSHNKMTFRDLLDNEKQTKEKINGLPQIINKSIIIKERLKDYKKTCNSCNKELENIYTCSSCNRCRYDSKECQIKDWNTHKDECLYNITKTANDIIKKKNITTEEKHNIDVIADELEVDKETLLEAAKNTTQTETSNM